MVMNNAFDILNCRTKYSKSPFNLALSPSTFDKYLDFTNRFEKYVHSLMLSSGQKVIESLRKTGFIGILWGLKNLINYYTFLKYKKYDIEYILSYKLSQDHHCIVFQILGSNLILLFSIPSPHLFLTNICFLSQRPLKTQLHINMK